MLYFINMTNERTFFYYFTPLWSLQNELIFLRTLNAKLHHFSSFLKAYIVFLLNFWKINVVNIAISLPLINFWDGLTWLDWRRYLIFK